MKMALTTTAKRMKRVLAPLRNRRGVTLVELVILLVIAAIVLPGLMMYFIESMNHGADTQMESVGLGLAQELMEEIKSKRWDENVPIPSGAYSALLGPEAGETRCDPAVPGCTPYDDIDDYQGLNNSPPQDPQGSALPSTYSGYREQGNVCYVNGPLSVTGGGNNADAGVCVTGPTTTDYKKITVTVTWSDGNGHSQHVQLDTVMTNYHLTS